MANNNKTYLRSHVTLRTDSVIERNVYGVRCYVVPDRQTEIADGASSIGFDENVFRFQITVRYRRFT